MAEMNKQPFTEKIKLPPLLDEFRSALEEEIDYIKKSGQSSTLLRNGYEIRSEAGSYWYQFKVDYAPTIPADTPCKLIVGNKKYDVSAISFSGSEMVLQSKCQIPGPLNSVRLENGSTVLMESLITCIEENAEKSNLAGHRMLPRTETPTFPCHKIYNYSETDIPRRKENLNQYRAVMSALTNDITYIWGPPGTGKTTVIGRIVEELYKRERSVLLVSHTNKAVTGAVENILDAKKGHNISGTPCPVLRLGKPDSTWPEGVSLKEHTDILGKDLYEKRTALEKEQSRVVSEKEKLSRSLSKAAWIAQSQLEVVASGLGQLNTNRESVLRLQEDYDKITSEIEEEEQLHPEYNQFHKLTGMLGYKKAQHKENTRRIEENEHQQRSLSEKTQNALDEIRKHDVYSALLAKRETMMTPHFLEGKLREIQEQHTGLQEQIDELANQKAKNDAIIAAYEKKSAIIKFFSGKNAILEMQTVNEVILSKLSPLKDELQKVLKMESSYQDQLDAATMLESKIYDATPKNTKAYWEKIAEDTQSELHETEKVIAELHIEQKRLLEDIADLEPQIFSARKSCETIKTLQQKRDEIDRLLHAAEISAENLNERCRNLLHTECAWCSLFARVEENQPLAELYQQFDVLYRKTTAEVAAMNVPALQAQHDSLEQAFLKIREQIEEINEKLRELEKQAIMDAPIVGATLTKTYRSKELRERTFDTVILDEASMAPIPALWCASYLAEKNVVIVGDFLQLPPIVLSDNQDGPAKKWLGKDIFWHSGIQAAVENGTRGIDHFVKLNDQFRMEKKIADIANIYYNRGNYGGLKSNDEAAGRIAARSKFNAWYPGSASESPVRLIDTESLHAWVTGIPQGKGHSRLNCFSAAVDVDLAFECIEPKLSGLDRESSFTDMSPSVLIVAPYKPHVKLLNHLIEARYVSLGFKHTPPFIQAGTIHSFQGSEADIVIFDLVVDEPHWNANLFMTDEEVNSDLKKMFNVAVTRAKFRLFVVGNFAYFQKRAKNNALSELMNHLLNKEGLAKEDAKALLHDLVFTPPDGIMDIRDMDGHDILCNESTFYDYFRKDISGLRAGERMIVYSPFMTQKKLGDLRAPIMDAIARGAALIVVTKSLKDRGKKELSYYQDCEDSLKMLGVKVVHKADMHEKLVFVGNRAIWTGSLNALSSTGNTREVMERRTGEELIKHYKDFMDIDHIETAINHDCELSCPICGGEMLLKEGKNGGIYWECIAGDFSRGAEQAYPVDGIITCRKCGKPLKFVMKTEPRWVCTDNPKHYQKIREGDLKLEKMRALIPTKRELREVEKFFAEKKKEREKNYPKRNPARNKATKEKEKTTESVDQIKLF